MIGCLLYGIAGLLVQAFAEYLVWRFDGRRLVWQESLKVGLFWPFALGWMIVVMLKTLRG